MRALLETGKSFCSPALFKWEVKEGLKLEHSQYVLVYSLGIAITFTDWKIQLSGTRMNRDCFLLEGGSPRARKFRDSFEMPESVFQSVKDIGFFHFLEIH